MRPTNLVIPALLLALVIFLVALAVNRWPGDPDPAQPAETIIAQEPEAAEVAPSGRSQAQEVEPGVASDSLTQPSDKPQAPRTAALPGVSISGTVWSPPKPDPQPELEAAAQCDETHQGPCRDTLDPETNQPPDDGRTRYIHGEGEGTNGACHPDYEPCLPWIGEASCDNFDGPVRVKVIGVDPWGIDPDGDGVGCQSEGRHASAIEVELEAEINPPRVEPKTNPEPKTEIQLPAPTVTQVVAQPEPEIDRSSHDPAPTTTDKPWQPQGLTARLLANGKGVKLTWDNPMSHIPCKCHPDTATNKCYLYDFGIVEYQITRKHAFPGDNTATKPGGHPNGGQYAKSLIQQLEDTPNPVYNKQGGFNEKSVSIDTDGDGTDDLDTTGYTDYYGEDQQYLHDGWPYYDPAKHGPDENRHYYQDAEGENPYLYYNPYAPLYGSDGTTYPWAPEFYADRTWDTIRALYTDLAWIDYYQDDDLARGDGSTAIYPLLTTEQLDSKWHLFYEVRARYAGGDWGRPATVSVELRQ